MREFLQYRNNGKDSVETLVIKSGRLFACQHCDTLYNLGIIKNMEDSIDLDEKMKGEGLAKKIKGLIHKEYYQACQFCNPSLELVETAGEQGIDDGYIVK